jgi:hypothetical protein
MSKPRYFIILINLNKNYILPTPIEIKDIITNYILIKSIFRISPPIAKKVKS